jgi:hypothetical protein
MRSLFLISLMSMFYATTSAQFVARMEVKEPIPGLCNDKEVYVLFPSFKGQVEAVCPLSEEKILERLNSEVQFLKDNPTHEDKGMMGLVINCKGDVVQCKMDNKTKDPELDKQIETVFNSLGEWKAGKLKKKNVDTSKLFSFKIKDGKITFD